MDTNDSQQSAFHLISHTELPKALSLHLHPPHFTISSSSLSAGRKKIGQNSSSLSRNEVDGCRSEPEVENSGVREGGTLSRGVYSMCGAHGASRRDGGRRRPRQTPAGMSSCTRPKLHFIGHGVWTRSLFLRPAPCVSFTGSFLSIAHVLNGEKPARDLTQTDLIYLRGCVFLRAL